MSKTIGMIKPDAVANGQIDNILQDITNAGFTVVRRAHGVLDRADAESLYEEHREKSHFNDLVDFTVSGPVELLELEHAGPDAPAEFRKLMGPTKLEDATPGTLRHKYATDFRRNAIHGSDSKDSAVREFDLFNRYFG